MTKREIAIICDILGQTTIANRAVITSQHESLVRLSNNLTKTMIVIVEIAKSINLLAQRVIELEPTVENTQSRVIFNESEIEELRENLESATSKIQE